MSCDPLGDRDSIPHIPVPSSSVLFQCVGTCKCSLLDMLVVVSALLNVQVSRNTVRAVKTRYGVLVKGKCCVSHLPQEWYNPHPLFLTQNRKGAVSELEHIPDAVLCDVHSHDGVVIAG